jgi:hypothetical protein
MLDHFHAFKEATNDVVWDNVITTTYGMIATIQTNHSASTGLLPDFCTGNPVKPAAPNFLESDNDGNYYYNASRVPLRIVMDYGHYGDTRAKDAVNKIVTWAKTTTGNNASKFKAGYTLAGANVSGNNYYDAVFVAPIVAGSIVDPNNQAFLNAGWTSILASKDNYFADTYNLLCQLFISGNWWIPQEPVVTGIAGNQDLAASVSLTPNPANQFLNILYQVSEGHVQASVYNLIGEQVIESVTIEGNAAVDISTLNAGMYIVKITNGKASISKVFVKE